MNTKRIERGELTATFTFAVALLVALLATWVSGCGDSSPAPTRDDLPVVEIACDVNACTVLVWDASEVEAYYDGFLEWTAEVTPTRRATFREVAPEGVLEVVACNAVGCVSETALIEREPAPEPPPAPACVDTVLPDIEGATDLCWRQQYVTRCDRDPAMQWERVRYECEQVDA